MLLEKVGLTAESIGIQPGIQLGGYRVGDCSDLGRIFTRPDVLVSIFPEEDRLAEELRPDLAAQGEEQDNFEKFMETGDPRHLDKCRVEWRDLGVGRGVRVGLDYETLGGEMFVTLLAANAGVLRWGDMERSGRDTSLAFEFIGIEKNLLFRPLWLPQINPDAFTYWMVSAEARLRRLLLTDSTALGMPPFIPQALDSHSVLTRSNLSCSIFCDEKRFYAHPLQNWERVVAQMKLYADWYQRLFDADLAGVTARVLLSRRLWIESAFYHPLFLKRGKNLKSGGLMGFPSSRYRFDEEGKLTLLWSAAASELRHLFIDCTTAVSEGRLREADDCGGAMFRAVEEVIDQMQSFQDFLGYAVPIFRDNYCGATHDDYPLFEWHAPFDSGHVQAREYITRLLKLRLSCWNEVAKGGSFFGRRIGSEHPFWGEIFRLSLSVQKFLLDKAEGFRPAPLAYSVGRFCFEREIGDEVKQLLAAMKVVLKSKILEAIGCWEEDLPCALDEETLAADKKNIQEMRKALRKIDKILRQVEKEIFQVLKCDDLRRDVSEKYSFAQRSPEPAFYADRFIDVRSLMQALGFSEFEDEIQPYERDVFASVEKAPGTPESEFLQKQWEAIAPRRQQAKVVMARLLQAAPKGAAIKQVLLDYFRLYTLRYLALKLDSVLGHSLFEDTLIDEDISAMISVLALRLRARLRTSDYFAYIAPNGRRYATQLEWLMAEETIAAIPLMEEAEVAELKAMLRDRG